MSIDVRPVRAGDAAFQAVARLRYAVYAEEENLTLAGMDHTTRTLCDELDPCSLIFAAHDGETMVGTIRWTPISAFPAHSDVRQMFCTQRFPVPESQMALVGRLMVAPEHRGSAACLQLFAAGFRAGLAAGLEVAFLECSPRNTGLYESIGCRRLGAAFSDRLAGISVPMAGLLRDARHFARVGSPLLGALPAHQADTSLADWFEREFAQFADPCSVRMFGAGSWDALYGELMAIEPSPFEGITAAEAQRVLRSATLLDVAPGTVLLDAGSHGTEMYLVLRGEMVLKAPALGTAPTASLLVPAGHVFAEGGLLRGTHDAFGFDAVAAAPARLLALSAESFAALRRARPELARRAEAGIRRQVALRDSAWESMGQMRVELTSRPAERQEM